MMYSNILVAYDGSEISNLALDKAVEIAKLDPANRLHVLHVYRFPDIIIGEAYISVTPNMNEAIFEEANGVADQAKKKIEHLPNLTTVDVTEGQPAPNIIKYAEQNQCDLIVIGNRGHSGIRELVLGSVSHNVVQHAHIPVLVIKK